MRLVAKCHKNKYNSFVGEGKEEGRVYRGAVFGRDLFEFIRVLAIALAIVLPIRYYVAQPFLVRGASMEPSFEDRDYLIIDELTYQFREPERGETIVFRYPKDPRQFFIKRVVGLPGERVVIKDGKITIFNTKNPDGFLLDEIYLDPPNHPTRPDMTVALERDQYFLLGDNRDFSSDSRVWGLLDRDLIVGRAIFRAWPLERWGSTLIDF